MDKKEVKKIADTEVKAHEKRMHKGAAKFAKGGVTSENMKKYGRNLARAMNQKSAARGR
jgi:predicted transcriptional regulator